MALIGDVAMAVSAPFLIVLPATILLVWVAVRRGLVPLERLRRSIVSRNADTLDPIGEHGVPVEVLPLVSALNGLFARLSEAFERERRFTGDAAHELRTPLTGIKTQLQIAQSAGGAIRERALGQAEVGVDRMSRLVSQMLLLARLETEPGELSEPESCAAGDELQAVLHTLRPLAAKHEVQLLPQNEIAAVTVRVPASMLHAALRNLLENSIKHTPPGKQITITIELTPSHLQLRIVDEGPGIPPEALARVTQRFYRVAVADAGTGLGLSIVAAVAHRYNMRLHLENRAGQAGLISGLDIPRHSRASHP
jgi:signal transduction histidine kinase